MNGCGREDEQPARVFLAGEEARGLWTSTRLPLCDEEGTGGPGGARGSAPFGVSERPLRAGRRPSRRCSCPQCHISSDCPRARLRLPSPSPGPFLRRRSEGRDDVQRDRERRPLHGHAYERWDGRREPYGHREPVQGRPCHRYPPFRRPPPLEHLETAQPACEGDEECVARPWPARRGSRARGRGSPRPLRFLPFCVRPREPSRRPQRLPAALCPAVDGHAPPPPEIPDLRAVVTTAGPAGLWRAAARGRRRMPSPAPPSQGVGGRLRLLLGISIHLHPRRAQPDAHVPLRDGGRERLPHRPGAR